MQSTDDETAIYQRPAELLQRLIRFDTTNPPGNEAACVAYIADLLRAAGIEPRIVARDPARPNLIARLPGRGKAPPLLLYGHVDVVTTAHQEWTHAPFAGVEADGYIWGRGALDMKGGVAMLLAAFLRARAENLRPPGDVVLAILSDEEQRSDHGAGYLVEQHPGLFEGVRYALGEFGGFSFQLGARRFYPIMVAEKLACPLKATVRGPGGHGSLPMRGGAMARLSRFLHTLDTRRLPVHITPVARQMIEIIADNSPFATRLALRQLLHPARTDRVLDLLGPRASFFDPLLHHVVNATMVRGGESGNVIPAEVSVHLDTRILPGFTVEDVIAELRALAGPEVAFEVMAGGERVPTARAEPDQGLFETLAGVLREADPEGIPMPLLLAATTDGYHFARLGIQTYGFLPMRLPADFSFTELLHAADERIPVEALSFGARAIYAALQRFGG